MDTSCNGATLIVDARIKDFALRLQWLLKDGEFTIANLASDLDVDVLTIHDWCTAYALPDEDTGNRLCQLVDPSGHDGLWLAYRGAMRQYEQLALPESGDVFSYELDYHTWTTFNRACGFYADVFYTFLLREDTVWALLGDCQPRDSKVLRGIHYLAWRWALRNRCASPQVEIVIVGPSDKLGIDSRELKEKVTTTSMTYQIGRVVLPVIAPSEDYLEIMEQCRTNWLSAYQG